MCSCRRRKKLRIYALGPGGLRVSYPSDTQLTVGNLRWYHELTETNSSPLLSSDSLRGTFAYVISSLCNHPPRWALLSTLYSHGGSETPSASRVLVIGTRVCDVAGSASGGVSLWFCNAAADRQNHFASLPFPADPPNSCRGRLAYSSLPLVATAAPGAETFLPVLSSLCSARTPSTTLCF